MKKILFILSILFVSSCQGQEKQKNINTTNKDNPMIEKLDINLLEREGKKYPISDTDYSYELIKNNPDGSTYEISGSKYEKRFIKYETPPLPYFYKIYKEFYPNGYLKRKETYLGKNVKIDKSQYYNEEGKLIREIDENQKFGKIKPQQVLEFLQEKGYINLKTGEGRMDEEEHPVFKLYFEEENGKKTWYITIVKGRPIRQDEFPEFGEPPAFMPKVYEMDGETGKVTEVSEGIEDSSSVYKTHKGKTYTQEEWKSFEEQEYQNYVAKKNNRSFLADE